MCVYQLFLWELSSSSEYAFSIIQRFYFLGRLNGSGLKTFEGLLGAQCWTCMATSYCEYNLR